MLKEVQNYYISAKEMQDILDEFSKKVKNKEYRKLNYDKWRQLQSVAHCSFNNFRIIYDYIAPVNNNAIYCKLVIIAKNEELNKDWKILEFPISKNDKMSFAYFMDYDVVYDMEQSESPLADSNGVQYRHFYSDEYLKQYSIEGLDIYPSEKAKRNRYVYEYDKNVFVQNKNWTTLNNTNTNIAYGVVDINNVIADVGCNTTRLPESWEKLQEAVSDLNNKFKEKEKKGNEKMKGFNFDFGSCENYNVRMSMYGIAIKNSAGEWVSYNATTGDIINVDIFNFEARRYLFRMPVAISAIAVGDVLIHNRVPMFVTNIENGIEVTDIFAGEKKTIIPTKNIFNFDFVTKVVSLFDTFQSAPTPDQPFGNMLPFLMMGEDNNDVDPMMLFFMMKDNKDTNAILPFLFMGNGFAAPVNPAG